MENNKASFVIYLDTW